MKRGYVYIMMNRTRTTLYVGVTSNLSRRTQSHKEGRGSKFTSRYKLTDLVYYEQHDSIVLAIAREKQLKNWKREWKLELIQSVNPDLKDLSTELRSGLDPEPAPPRQTA